MSTMTTEPLRTDAAFDTNEDKWAAIRNRDPLADGRFFYAVRTTGVYCRPSCAARLPNRENISFFSTRDEAEGDGFRPCKRCRPDEAPLAQRQAATIAEACRLIEQAEETPSLDDLAEA